MLLVWLDSLNALHHLSSLYKVLIVAGPTILFIQAKRCPSVPAFFPIFISSYSLRSPQTPSPLSINSTAQYPHCPPPPQLPNFFLSPRYNSISLLDSNVLRKLSPTLASSVMGA